jgi:HEAT repeat protein
MKLKSLLTLLALSLPVFAIDDAPFQELKTYDFQNRKPVETINALIRGADMATQGEIETKLLAVAQDPATTFAAQQEIGKMLWKVGSGRSVPVLAKWLGDEKLNDVARYALEGNTDPAAAQALRGALATTKGKALAGVITSVGERRDSMAVPVLKGFLGNPDTAIANAAIAALGKIATPAAITTLQGAPNKSLAVYQALLSAANQGLIHTKSPTLVQRTIMDDKNAPSSVRMAAAQSILRTNQAQAPTLILELLRGDNADLRDVAARYVRESGVPTRQLIAEAEKLPAPGQALLLSALGDRRDASALPLLLRVGASTNADVRLAALRALGPMEGNAEAVTLLAKTIARGTSGAEKEAARQSLAALRGKTINDAIVAAIPGAETDIRRELIWGLGQRYARSAKPQLLTWANDNNLGVSDVAANALGEIATAEDYPAVVKLLTTVPGQGRGAAENLVLRIARELNNETERTGALITAVNAANPETRVSLLKVLASLGGTEALAAVRTNLKNPDAKIQDAAIRALAGTPDRGAMPDLLDLAQNAPTKAQQILALRGYLRLAEGAAQDNKTNGAKVAELYTPAIKFAGETQEKRSIIAGLSKINTPETLVLITPFLDDENTRGEAAQAVINIVREFKGANPRESRTALDRIAATVKDENLFKQSNELLQKLPAN